MPVLQCTGGRVTPIYKANLPLRNAKTHIYQSFEIVSETIGITQMWLLMSAPGPQLPSLNGFFPFFQNYLEAEKYWWVIPTPVTRPGMSRPTHMCVSFISGQDLVISWRTEHLPLLFRRVNRKVSVYWAFYIEISPPLLSVHTRTKFSDHSAVIKQLLISTEMTFESITFSMIRNRRWQTHFMNHYNYIIQLIITYLRSVSKAATFKINSRRLFCAMFDLLVSICPSRTTKFHAEWKRSLYSKAKHRSRILRST